MASTFGLLLIGIVIGGMIGIGIGWMLSPKQTVKENAPDPPAAIAKADRGKQNCVPSLGLVLQHRGGKIRVLLDGVEYGSYASMPRDSQQRLLAYLGLARDWIKTESKATSPSPAVTPAPTFTPTLQNAKPQHKTIAEQIDAVLQDLAQEAGVDGIRIVPNLKGGVSIIVGKERYERVADMPEGKVKTLVVQAVKIWEKRAGK